MKKIILSLLILPLLFSFASITFARPTNAASICASIVLTAITGTGYPKADSGGKIWQFKINNRDTANDCYYTFFASNPPSGWSSNFYKIYVYGVGPNTPITSTTSLKVARNSSATFYTRIIPTLQTRKTPGTTTFRIRAKNNAATTMIEYEDVGYTITTADACKARSLECGGYRGDGVDLGCGSCEGNNVCTSNKCVPPPTYNLVVANVLIDKNGNYTRDSGEFCYSGGHLTLRVAGIAKAWTSTTRNADCTGKFSMSRTTKTVQVGLSLESPDSDKYVIQGLKYADNTTNALTEKTGVSGTNITGNGTVYYYIKPKSVTKTLSFNGQLFIDTNGDGRMNNGEVCYKGGYTIKAGDTSETINSSSSCSTYSISTTTPNDSVLLRVPVIPTGYNATKLNFKFTHLGDTTIETAPGASKLFSANNTVNFGIKPTNQKTLTFSGSVFIDDGIGGGTARNGLRDGGEKFYKGDYIVKATGTNTNTSTKNGDNYSVSAQSTSSNSVNVSLVFPSSGGLANYKPTRLNYRYQQPDGDFVPTTAAGSSRQFSASNTVNFGVEPKNPTITVEYILIDDGDLTKETNEKCDVNPNTLLTVNGVSKTWSNRLIGCTGSYTLDNDGVTKIGIKPASTYNLVGLSYSDEVAPGVPKNVPNASEQNIKGKGFIRFFVKQKPNTSACNAEPTFEKNGSPTSTAYSVTYPLKLKNNNTSALCLDSAKSFTLSVPNLKTGWTKSFSSNPVIAANGVTKEFTLKITRPQTGVTPDTYTINARATNNNSNPVVLPLRYVVTDPDATPTRAPTPTGNPTTNPTPGPDCTPAAFDFNVTPPNLSAPAGATATYDVAIKNNDSKCGAKTFKLTKAISGNTSGTWTANLSDNEFSLGSGDSKTVKLNVKSPAGANIGVEKQISVTAQKGTNAPKSKNVIYKVKAGDGPTPTPDPATPTPGPGTPTPIPDGTTNLHFFLGLDGIGTTPRYEGNKEPISTMGKPLNFMLYNATNNTLSYSVTDMRFVYNSESKKFELNYELTGANVPTGIYNVYVDGPQYLRNQYPGSVTITQGETTKLDSPNFFLITGNTTDSGTSDNNIDLLDYNIIINCVSTIGPARDCDDERKALSDLDDNGIVDQIDLNLWYKEVGNQSGVVIPLVN